MKANEGSGGGGGGSTNMPRLILHARHIRSSMALGEMVLKRKCFLKRICKLCFAFDKRRV